MQGALKEQTSLYKRLKMNELPSFVVLLVQRRFCIWCGVIVRYHRVLVRRTRTYSFAYFEL